MTVQGVRALEKRGELPAKRDENGNVSYALEDVQRLAHEREELAKQKPRAWKKRVGERALLAPLTARIAKMIREGRSMTDIVIATRVDPNYVRRVWLNLRTPLDQTPAVLERERVEQEMRELEEERARRDGQDLRAQRERLRRRRG